ncbi:oxidoreductase [Aureococcus anophagefferens]|nr:oxidoreductase [Aureococcus anophagefferens]
MHYATALEIEEKRCAPLPRVVIGCWQLLERDNSRDAADSSKANAVAVNKQSRKSLRVESLDLVQFHWWDFSDGAYVQYSLLDRRPENGVIALATKRGLQLTCFGTAAGGWLSDKYLGAPEPTRSDVSKGTVSLRMYKSSLDAWGPWSLFQELLKTLRAVGDELDASIAAVAVAWVLDALDRSCGGSVILGVRDASHLDDHVRARDLALDDAHRRSAVLDRRARGDIWSRERG